MSPTVHGIREREAEYERLKQERFKSGILAVLRSPEGRAAIAEVAGPIMRPPTATLEGPFDDKPQPFAEEPMSLTVTGDPLADIEPGLYELHWKDGRTGLAAVGRGCGGAPWFTPCDRGLWRPDGRPTSNDWSDIVGAVAIRLESDR